MAEGEHSFKGNYEAFSATLPADIGKNIALLRDEDALLDSYGMIATVNAMKIELLKDAVHEEAFRFFSEAHNDLLISHMNASFGSWRPALQALRSFMENHLAAVYYSDHPVELRLWTDGKFSISPRELREYVCSHPSVCKVAPDVNVKGLLDGEYATLSKAVHASNDLFRMTGADGAISIMDADKAELGKWHTRQKAVIDACMLVVCVVYCSHLEGAKLPRLRESLGRVLKKASKAVLKKNFSVIVK